MNCCTVIEKYKDEKYDTLIEDTRIFLSLLKSALNNATNIKELWEATHYFSICRQLISIIESYTHSQRNIDYDKEFKKLQDIFISKAKKLNVIIDCYLSP